jgi:hypothetical protein
MADQKTKDQKPKDQKTEQSEAVVISIPKIISGLNKSLETESTLFKGVALLKYLGKSKIDIPDDIVTLIAPTKTLKNQPNKVLEFFSKTFKDEAGESEPRKKLLTAVQSHYKLHGIPFSGLTPVVLFFMAKNNNKTLDLNIFRTSIKKWKDEDYTKAFSMVM